jgi:hypothetical protein
MYAITLWMGLALLLTITFFEIFNPKMINEGFSTLISVGDSAIWSKWMPRRGDVGMEVGVEPDGYIRNPRYFAGYTDVQRLGQDHDFCRMVQTPDESDQFFACALGGTEGLTSVKYRTIGVRDGLELSRDDYVNDLGEGRAAYGRILKRGDEFQPLCYPAGDTSFKSTQVLDPNPPPHIQRLLSFYEGIVIWLRLRDDLLDYAKNITVLTYGKMEIDEVPKEKTEGLVFDGTQYLQVGEPKDLSFGQIVELRYIRAFCFWVYFDEFTNNAKVFDFGTQNQPAVFCGIIGRGNQGVSQSEYVDESLKTIPSQPSGAQCTLEESPQASFANSRADIERWNCPNPGLFGKIVPPLFSKAPIQKEATTADLLYELFDERQRVLHIQVKNVFPLRKWTHVVITATSEDSKKPDIQFFINGESKYVERGAWLPQMNFTKQNYIGRSNTASATSKYDNKDELFKGRLFDFRAYRTHVTEKKVKDMYSWGQDLLVKELLVKDLE